MSRRAVVLCLAAAACNRNVVIELGPCAQLVSCVGVTDTAGTSDVGGIYGEGGSCWSEDATAQEICRDQCVEQLKTIAAEDREAAACPSYDWDALDGGYEGPILMTRGEDCAFPQNPQATANLRIERTAPDTILLRNASIVASRLTWIPPRAWSDTNCSLAYTGGPCVVNWTDAEGRAHLGELDDAQSNGIDFKWTVEYTETCTVVFRGELIRTSVL